MTVWVFTKYHLFEHIHGKGRKRAVKPHEEEDKWRLLTIAEAAEMLSVSEKTIRKWLLQGKLKGVKVGFLWRLRKKDLEDFIREK